MHCNLRPPDATPVIFRCNYNALSSLKSLNLSIAFMLLTHYFMLWLWPLTLWPWLLISDLEHLQCIACTKFERKSRNLRRSYCNFNIGPNDIEHYYVLRVALGSGAIFTKLDLRQLIRAWILLFLMLIHYVTLWSWPLTSWPWKFVVHQASRCQSLYKFERNRTISGWIIDNFTNFCTGYVALWPWLLDLELLKHFRCHAFKLFTKFERNRIIHAWVIDDVTRFRRAILGGGAFLRNGSQRCVDSTSPNLART